MTDYATLEALNARAGTLGEALSILHWDQQALPEQFQVRHGPSWRGLLAWRGQQDRQAVPCRQRAAGSSEPGFPARWQRL